MMVLSASLIIAPPFSADYLSFSRHSSFVSPLHFPVADKLDISRQHSHEPSDVRQASLSPPGEYPTASGKDNRGTALTRMLKRQHPAQSPTSPARFPGHECYSGSRPDVSYRASSGFLSGYRSTQEPPEETWSGLELGG